MRKIQASIALSITLIIVVLAASAFPALAQGHDEQGAAEEEIDWNTVDYSDSSVDLSQIPYDALVANLDKISGSNRLNDVPRDDLVSALYSRGIHVNQLEGDVSGLTIDGASLSCDSCVLTINGAEISNFNGLTVIGDTIKGTAGNGAIVNGVGLTAGTEFTVGPDGLDVTKGTATVPDSYTGRITVRRAGEGEQDGVAVFPDGYEMRSGGGVRNADGTYTLDAGTNMDNLDENGDGIAIHGRDAYLFDPNGNGCTGIGNCISIRSCSARRRARR